MNGKCPKYGEVHADFAYEAHLAINVASKGYILMHVK